ncbi:neutral zinc metallopeptidase [Pontibacter mangrovi]|uniref:Uncharacterized protein n=1 Tax=Pontibacter mangrovi TaxID=2589816 RepID=A0A501W4Y4_9BACT|nr:hypothetical protein [Pontibacter mangrovi]TPE43852.1 hypothetical protein FJM65_10485 [Pontibacter mangrovi]
MKHLKLITTGIAFSFFILTGCEKEPESITSPATAGFSAQHSSELQINADALRASLPEGFEERLQHSTVLLSNPDPQYRSMVNRALAIEEDPNCDANTATSLWLDEQLADWFDANGRLDPNIAFALNLAALDLPTYDALVFENSSDNQYYGVKGQYTKQVTKAFKDLQRFWDISSEDIVLAAMHGSMLTNKAKVARTYEAVYGMPPAMAAVYADAMVELASGIPQLRGGDHPIFTFNAFALQGFNFGPYGTIPDKIIMGDGIMDAFAAVGYSDVAPQAILAHEFAHQIQYELNLFGSEDSPEATRRTELMADAYSAYYLSHARGATMQWKRVQQFLQVFFNIGDCSFSSTGHHGTPTQRMAAAEWGYNLANDAQKQGHIMSAQEFAERFDAHLSQLVML